MENFKFKALSDTVYSANKRGNDYMVSWVDDIGTSHNILYSVAEVEDAFKRKVWVKV